MAQPRDVRGASGWLDLVILHHARRINSLTEIVVTKLDILSGVAEYSRLCGLRS